MEYSEFKPASRSYELLGSESDERNELDNENSEIQTKIVIYRNVDLITVKKTYPTFGGKPNYRFVEYGEAIAFLDKQLSELKALENDGDIESARKELISECEQTRSKITERLGV